MIGKKIKPRFCEGLGVENELNHSFYGWLDLKERRSYEVKTNHPLQKKDFAVIKEAFEWHEKKMNNPKIEKTLENRVREFLNTFEKIQYDLLYATDCFEQDLGNFNFNGKQKELLRNSIGNVHDSLINFRNILLKKFEGVNHE